MTDGLDPELRHPPRIGICSPKERLPERPTPQEINRPLPLTCEGRLIGIRWGHRGRLDLGSVELSCAVPEAGAGSFFRKRVRV